MLTLGILGGMGPMATVRFYELITRRTAARCDREHLDVVLCSRASTPDRTAYLLGESRDNPALLLTEDARRLERFGAAMLAIPCNTAHAFYEDIRRAVKIPVLHMIRETVAAARADGHRTLGLLATAGTVKSGIYDDACRVCGMHCIAPLPAEQEEIGRLIYDGIKAGRETPRDELLTLSRALIRRGADCVVYGCTELSLLYRGESGVYDAMTILADRAIERLGATVREVV